METKGYRRYACYIHTVTNTHFVLTCYDGEYPDFDCDVPIKKIREFDRKYIKIGALVILYVRYATMKRHQKTGVIFKFVKKYWTKEEIDDARARAKELAKIFE